MKPPTIEQVASFIEELKVNYSTFEFFYGIPYGTLRGVLKGRRDVPSKFWWIFYERIVPQYGIGLNYNKPRTKNRTTVQYTQRKTPSKDNRLVVIE